MKNRIRRTEYASCSLRPGESLGSLEQRAGCPRLPHILPGCSLRPFLGADKVPVTFPTRKERPAAEEIGQSAKTKPKVMTGYDLGVEGGLKENMKEGREAGQKWALWTCGAVYKQQLWLK